ncbi:hypothetical protein H2198_003062 [Neophaeococcomyces mojaviensis]|uniref:Uncharacterized protein n=1 Tax=Neophaeococcomyces mojaviensis TaxID=3383035 RepID=A0ACC3ACA5_9EURO|nr:hypothetical protein H2198_003062 [Knufia sp. JES_112]
MVLLTATPTILHAVSLLPSDLDFATMTPPIPKSPDQPISHATILALSKHLRQIAPRYTLNTLLRGTRPYVSPPPSRPEPSPEYQALMARLREEEERKNYRRMLQQQEEMSLQAQSAEAGQPEEKDDISPSLVLNILLSVVMCAGVAFYLTRWWGNDGVRVLVSLGTGIVVGVAEVVVYNAYLRKVEESRRIERNKREKKVVVAEYTGEGSDVIEAWGENKEIETTEIWGKGVHGGMRRRVREKWEREQEQDQEDVKPK